MRSLHILQGGIENGDKAWLERAAGRKLNARSWVAPRAVDIGDDIVIYISGYGFFATAEAKSLARPRPDWANRYGADLTAIKLIRPAISLATIRRRIPGLTWAIYPRSITTPLPEVANQIRELISLRRRTRRPDLDPETLTKANIDELRVAALLKSRPFAPVAQRKAIVRIRSLAISLYVLRRANGYCEGCGTPAPFEKHDGTPYLEPHHTKRLSDDGPDHPARVIALCPNCHRRAHYAIDSKEFNTLLMRKLRELERL
jgi:5-methylcytosine-specific restriction endonuclease McrA